MIEGCRHEEISEEGFCRDCGARAAIKLSIKIGDEMSEGVKYPMLHVMIKGSMFECEQVRVARVELAGAERTALDYDRIDALRLAAEKEVDVLAGELEVARKRIGALCESFIRHFPTQCHEATGYLIRCECGWKSVPYKANWRIEDDGIAGMNQWKEHILALDRGQS